MGHYCIYHVGYIRTLALVDHLQIDSPPIVAKMPDPSRNFLRPDGLLYKIQQSTAIVSATVASASNTLPRHMPTREPMSPLKYTSSSFLQFSRSILSEITQLFHNPKVSIFVLSTLPVEGTSDVQLLLAKNVYKTVLYGRSLWPFAYLWRKDSVVGQQKLQSPKLIELRPRPSFNLICRKNLVTRKK